MVPIADDILAQAGHVQGGLMSLDARLDVCTDLGTCLDVWLGILGMCGLCIEMCMDVCIAMCI